MKKDDIKTREIMIARNGKPLFAVCLNPEESGDKNYVFVENGEIKFASSWFNSIQPFTVGNESHRIAKEIFTEGLRTAIKVRILELKQLESIFSDVGLADCLGNILVDNTRLLLEVKENLTMSNSNVLHEIQDIKSKVEGIETISKDDVSLAVEKSITDTVQPIALKKRARPSKQ